MSACAKFQLLSLSRSSRIVCCGWGGVVWGGFQESTVSNLNSSYIEMKLEFGFDN